MSSDHAWLVMGLTLCGPRAGQHSCEFMIAMTIPSKDDIVIALHPIFRLLQTSHSLLHSVPRALEGRVEMFCLWLNLQLLLILSISGLLATVHFKHSLREAGGSFVYVYKQFFGSQFDWMLTLLNINHNFPT